jgi:hypothetical protein
MSETNGLLESLTAAQRYVLLKAIKSDVGFWEGSGIPLEDFKNRFANIEQPYIGGIVNELVRQEFFEIDGREVSFTRLGFSLAQMEVQFRVDHPDAGLPRFESAPAPNLVPSRLSPPPIGAPTRIHRGANTRAMAEYAAEVGGQLVVDGGRRCSFCPHTNGWFIERGGMRLCQVTFGQGRRPWKTRKR